MGRDNRITANVNFSYEDFSWGVILMASLLMIGEALELGVGRYGNVVGAFGFAIALTILAIGEFRQDKEGKAFAFFLMSLPSWVWGTYSLLR